MSKPPRQDGLQRPVGRPVGLGRGGGTGQSRAFLVFVRIPRGCGTTGLFGVYIGFTIGWRESLARRGV